MKMSKSFIRLVPVILVLLLMMGLAVSQAQDTASYSITVEPIGHWHVFDSKVLIFSVFNLDTSEGVEGLELVVKIARAGSDRVTTRSVAEGQIQDEGDGLYSLEYTPSTLDSYAIAVNFTQDGETFFSDPVVFETSRAGEEGIIAEANDTSYVYQIRYNWEPGHIHANDEEAVTLIFELIRGIPTGDDINWEQPWRNPFDHVTDAQDAVLLLTTEDGSVSEELSLTYMGRGIYQAERVFSAEEVGEGQDYFVQCTFTDGFNGAEVQLAEAAVLHAVPAH